MLLNGNILVEFCEVCDVAKIPGAKPLPNPKYRNTFKRCSLCRTYPLMGVVIDRREFDKEGVES